MSPEAVFVRSPACFVREEDVEGGFLFNADTGRVSLLNPSAVRIWELLDGRRSVTDIVTELREVFTDTPPQLEQQVWDHLQALSRLGVVGRVGAAPDEADTDAPVR